MKLLAARTDCTWRYHRKTVLHIALENGREATESMIVSLNVSEDPQRHSKFQYVDRDGKTYSPTEWVIGENSLHVSKADKADPLACLARGNLLRLA